MSKIFGIGFHKTGTTTLDQVYQILGLNACPVRTDLAKTLIKGNLEPTLEVTRQFEAFQDNPWPLLFRELDAEFPGSKFILTYRADEKWINSAVNGFGSRKSTMREWIYGRGHEAPLGNEEVYLKRYQAHNEEVRLYFKDRPNDLLEISWEQGDGWEKICPFLGVEIPNIPFPHAGKGDYGKKKKGLLGFLK